MPKGYSVRVVEATRTGPDEHLGVQLGRKCIAKEISVIDVAEFFGVSRQTVYNWFMGKVSLSEEHAEQVRTVLKSL